MMVEECIQKALSSFSNDIRRNVVCTSNCTTSVRNEHDR